MLQEFVTARPPLRLVPRAVEPVERDLSFDELRDRARRLADAGRLGEALADLDRAVELAKAAESPVLVDLAVCNRATVLLVMGRHREVMAPLREILVRSADVKNACLAAYHLSRAHELDKGFKKGLFYGQLARDKAIRLGSISRLAQSYNQIGNCLLADSYFERAAEEYEMALALLPDEPSARRAMLLANLGYSRMMLEDVRGGMELSFRALRWFRRLGARVYLVWPHLDLCYGYLELDRVSSARRHAEAAQALAVAAGDTAALKVALFLLGEVERAAGDGERAFEYFHQLQRRFYPEAPQTAALMGAVSMRRVVNLRA